MKGELCLLNNMEYPIDKFSVTVSNYDFGFDLYIDDDIPLEEQLNQKEYFTYIIDDYIKHLELEEDVDEAIALYKKLKQNINIFWDYIEYVRISLEGVDIINFINSNPILKNKKIVLNECFEITDYEKIKKYIEQYEEYKDSLYVRLSGNQGYITLSKCYDTISKIKQYAERIKSLNLSPMETIMYTYDQVRNRVYKEEEKNDSILESRDLSSVLSGDKIVCVGYANIFCSLLKYMGINCCNIRLAPKNPNIKEGHERNLIYVNDEKYGIDGVYCFDATWDSKKDNETNEFLNRYRFFAKTRNEMVTIEKDIYNYEGFPYFSTDMVSDIKQVLENNDLEKLNKEYAQSINFMSRIINGENLIDRSCLFPFSLNYNQFDREKLLSNLSIIEEKYNRPISAETYIKLINNVRKIEYYENADFYPYSIENIYETYRRSEWKFSKHYYNGEEKFLLLLIGDEEAINANRNSLEKDFINYFKEEEILIEIKQVQLTKVLQKIIRR